MIGPLFARSPIGWRTIGRSPVRAVPGDYTAPAVTFASASVAASVVAALNATVSTSTPTEAAWQLEGSSDRWLLEDASGVWLLEAGGTDTKASAFTAGAAASGDGVPYVKDFKGSPVEAVVDVGDLADAVLVDAIAPVGVPTDGYVLKSDGGVPTWMPA